MGFLSQALARTPPEQTGIDPDWTQGIISEGLVKRCELLWQRAEGERLTGLGFQVCLCPKRHELSSTLWRAIALRDEIGFNNLFRKTCFQSDL
ncbi:MAG: hypothetical protein D6728_17595 [Cyanobacteria bacterium J055]|nr:MAG: hypothetical protein D6728_17595 [Cyanobacteria bacterium J055]